MVRNSDVACSTFWGKMLYILFQNPLRDRKNSHRVYYSKFWNIRFSNVAYDCTQKLLYKSNRTKSKFTFIKVFSQ